MQKKEAPPQGLNLSRGVFDNSSKSADRLKRGSDQLQNNDNISSQVVCPEDEAPVQQRTQQSSADRRALRGRSRGYPGDRTMAIPQIVSITLQSAVLSVTSNILAQAITAYKDDV